LHIAECPLHGSTKQLTVPASQAGFGAVAASAKQLHAPQ
jgi:hypothetical protein